MDDMIKLYIQKRKEYETKIKSDLLEIEKSVQDIAEPNDYFSIKDETIFTIHVREINGEKHLSISTEDNPEEILFEDLSLTNNPDLILWIIKHDNYIIEGFKEVLINAVRNGEKIVNTLRNLKLNYD